MIGRIPLKNKSGFDEYIVPRTGGLLPTEPKWTVPKEKNKNYIDMARKFTQNNPAPGLYHKPPNWKTPNGSFVKGPKKSVWDVLSSVTKGVPGPGSYKLENKEHILYGKTSKSVKYNFLSESEYMGKAVPGAKYAVKYDQVDKKIRHVKFIKNDKKEDWKPKKSVTPDVGTYNPSACLKLTKPSTKITMMTKSNIPTFIEKFSNYTKNNPAVGKYDPEKAKKVLYKPFRKYR